MLLLALAMISAASASPASRAASLQQRGLPRLGLGMAALGRPGYINLGHATDLPEERSVEAMRAQAHAVLDAAFAAGLRYFDCARSYGLSEEFVASWLAARPDAAEAVTAGSKWGYEYTAGWRIEVGEGEAHEQKELSLARLSRQLGETRELLPGVALYQIHSATLGVLEDAEVLEALGRLRDSGVVVGLSVSHPQVPTIEAAAAVSVGGKPLFGAVQATFNLLDQSAAAALRAAHEAGMFVIVKEGVANGRLIQGAPAALRDEAAARGCGCDALALAWVLSHEWVDMCLSGAATVEHLRSNAAALALAPLLTADVCERLATGCAVETEAYWAERRALAWN